MDNNTVTILVSFISLSVSVLALGWNIYRDIILKSKVKVSARVKMALGQTQQKSEKFVAITAVNFGPGAANLQMIHAKEKVDGFSGLFRSQHGIIKYIKIDPYSSALPIKIEMGDKAFFQLPYNKNCFLKNKLKALGISDVFGRVHWISKKDIRFIESEYQKDFLK